MSSSPFSVLPGAGDAAKRVHAMKDFLSLPFPVYAKKYLRIRTKRDGIQPFILNEGQLKLHEHTEAQMEARGYVRTVLLKARQWGGCLDPKTPVLTADLRWVPIKDLRIGDELVACDEQPIGTSRKMLTSTVEKVWSTRKKAYRITLDDGTSVVCSADHRWLSKKSQTQAEWRTIKATHPDGKRGGLVVGDSIRTIADVWGDADSDDGWFGGMIDGEGCFRAKKSGGNNLTVAQLAGAVMERMKEHCVRRGYGHYMVDDHNPRATKFGSRPVLTVNIGNMRQLFRVMGLSRPTRFISKRWWEGFRMPDNGWREITSIEPVEEMDLIDIQTSTGTYIANGLVSHNSTYIQGRFYRQVSSGTPGQRAVIMTHRLDATANLFTMAKRFHDNMADEFKSASPRPSATKLVFPKRDSSYYVTTAGSKFSGHSDTVQLLHASEHSMWPNANDHMAGIFQTVPNGEGTEIFIESTAKGMGNEFHRLCGEARSMKSDYWFIFIPWFLFNEYSLPVPKGMVLTTEDELYQQVHRLTDEQMAFRADKIASLGDPTRFQQQYPTTPEDAFQTSNEGSYIEPIYVVRARNARVNNPFGVRVMGIDPSHVGKDRFSVCMRQGRKAWHVGEWTGKRTEESLGRCVALIREHRPEYVFVDTGGPGAGVCDLLMSAGKRLGCKVYPIDFGGSPDDDRRYNNKREEMYGRGKEWLMQSMPVQIDDRDDLQADLTNPKLRYDSSGNPQPESKQTMCSAPRNLPSPDLAESFFLTFAYLVESAITRILLGGDSVDDADRPINWKAV